MKAWEFEILIQQKMQENPQWRKGQAAFLVAWEHVGDKINSVLYTQNDPFYNDNRLPDFMVYLTNNGFFSEDNLTDEEE